MTRPTFSKWVDGKLTHKLFDRGRNVMQSYIEGGSSVKTNVTC